MFYCSMAECYRNAATTAWEATAAAPQAAARVSVPTVTHSPPFLRLFGQARLCHLIKELLPSGFAERGMTHLPKDFRD